MEKLHLEGGVAVVTGGGSGIGLALAKACGAAGMKVAVTDISDARLAIASAALAQLGTPHATYEHDVADAAAWTRVADRIAAELGPPLVLFSNAGVVTAPGPLIEHEVAAWDWLV